MITRISDLCMGAPRKGQGGSRDPPVFRQNFSHIINVAPRVEIRMQGLNLPAPLDIQWPKMLSASGGFALLTPWPGALTLDPAGGSTPRTRYTLVLRTRHGAPPTTDPFRRLWPSEKILRAPLWAPIQLISSTVQASSSSCSSCVGRVGSRDSASVSVSFRFCAAGSRVVDGKSVELWRSVVSAQPSTSAELFVRPTRQRILSPSRVYAVYWIGRAEQNWRLNCRQFRQNMIAECNSYW